MILGLILWAVVLATLIGHLVVDLNTGKFFA